MASRGTIMASTEPADVAMLAIVESMRQIGDTNKQIAKTMERIHDEQREDRKLIIEVRDKVTQIEANKTSEKVSGIEERLKKVEDQHVVDAAKKTTLAQVWNELPRIGWVLGWIAIIALALLKLTGKM